ncbi:acetyl-CoA carboxylase biotin carboxylase subunit family protein [Lacihabitans sp. CS3-21]|uniref:ATP-grasp domain-containing protein n=1 Tax=Lacihabitans sp. CS3-21 TaxID=2487332 RepID=UPI0020CCD24C|nr:ATPase [Lacihabitans sp. CS3-21]MCP9748544.1 ATPase [Lacihabitans sp. CS3-21]
MTILCICTYFKGVEFLKAAKEEGNTVFLLTHKKIEHKPWPRESIDEFFYLENNDNSFDTYQTLLEGTAHLMRTRKIDLVVALDDFDVEKAALVREHFRIPGMGQTTARYFRDKLAMRVQAEDNQIPVPGFSALFNDVEITHFLENSTGPWLVKPRSEASASGIKKVYSKNEAWDWIHGLGDSRHNFLIETFKPGDVYHIDSLIINKEVVFERCSQYLSTPFDVAHGGGIFRSVTVEFGSLDQQALSLINHQVMKAFGMKFSASHTEVIKCHEDGNYYFLETASRVGGAHLAEMVEASSGINIWKEWAKIETAVAEKKPYILPKIEKKYSGILISLSSHQWPNMDVFDDKEIFWKMNEEYHVGLIVKADSRERVIELLDKYAKMVFDLGLHASAPAPDKPTH